MLDKVIQEFGLTLNGPEIKYFQIDKKYDADYNELNLLSKLTCYSYGNQFQRI